MILPSASQLFSSYSAHSLLSHRILEHRNALHRHVFDFPSLFPRADRLQKQLLYQFITRLGYAATSRFLHIFIFLAKSLSTYDYILSMNKQ